ncbi:N-acetylhexosaminidase [Cyathus striatus]|nr:N-acetylhexosaminidase [Cyathus striatus]
MRLIQALLVFTVLLPVFSLWPIPRSLQTGTSFLKLSSGFDISLDLNNVPSDLSDAASRSLAHIRSDKLERLTVGRGANDAKAISSAPSISRLSVSLSKGATIRPIAQEAVQPLGKRSEGYSLIVPADGTQATLTANSTLGLLRGLTTFEQLWYTLGDTVYTFQAPVKIINDTPAYPYRGLMLDTSRNFFAVADIKRTLDAMSMVKMSMFHWHVTDSQSFPLEIPGFTDIAQKGTYSTTQLYSTSDVQDIVSYAGQRGIDVLMEIDMPSHSGSISAAHPEHVACPQATPWSSFAAEPPSGQLRLASPATVNFTASMLTAIAKTLPSTLFSTGGDELNDNCYAQDSPTQAELKALNQTLEQALDTFMKAAHKSLIDLGKTPVVSEEMVLDYNITLANQTLVLVWISAQNATAVAAKNFHIIYAPSDYFFLDCGAGAWIGNDPSGNSWCDPFKTWQKAYTFDPLANIPAQKTSLILGGQQLLWSEQSSPENVDPIVWPRAASSAEVFWTGPTLPDGTPLSVETALPRLHDIRYRMVQRGIKAIALQPQWCALRPGACDG